MPAAASSSEEVARVEYLRHFETCETSEEVMAYVWPTHPKLVDGEPVALLALRLLEAALFILLEFFCGPAILFDLSLALPRRLLARLCQGCTTCGA